MFKAKNHILPTAEKALVMAVINLTPDSFYEGSRFDFSNAVAAAELAVKQGADIIDIGAQSTAPDSTPITAEEELQRLIQPLKSIRKAVDIPISVDTFFPEVAKAALENGADIINDVMSSLPSMLWTVPDGPGRPKKPSGPRSRPRWSGAISSVRSWPMPGGRLPA